MARLRWTITAACAALAAACGGGPQDDLPPIPDAEPPAYDAGRFDDMEDGVWKAYLQAQDALAHDRFEPAAAALAELARHSDGELQPLAEAAAQAEDLAGARVAFRALSTQVTDWPLPPGAQVAYCPMAFSYEGARWVQQKGTIMNPYYGASMLHCGAFEDDDAGD